VLFIDGCVLGVFSIVLNIVDYKCRNNKLEKEYFKKIEKRKKNEN
jgi:hypothetical protein